MPARRRLRSGRSPIAGLIARPTSQADQARVTRVLPVSVSTSTSATVALKLKTPIAGTAGQWRRGALGVERRSGANTQVWDPMRGPPAAQCARPEMAAKLTAMSGTPFSPTAPPGRSSRSCAGHEHLAGMLPSFFSTSAAAPTTEVPVTYVTRLAVVPSCTASRRCRGWRWPRSRPAPSALRRRSASAPCRCLADVDGTGVSSTLPSSSTRTMALKPGGR